MRHLVLVLAFLVACTKKEAAPATPPPEPVAKVAAKPEKVYVTASSLRLRKGPSSKARTRGRLAINSPLTPLETEGDFTKVRVENGKVGWVGSAYLAPKPVTKEAALTEAEAASDAKARLSWLQRAAAVATTDTTVLTRLREAYEAGGNTKGAASVGRLIDRLEARIKPNRDLESKAPKIEWVMLDHRHERPHGPVDRKEWGSFGLDADATFWVLPSFGPAVKGRAAKAEIDTVNECGGTTAIVVTVEPEEELGDALALAVAVGERPKGWAVDVPRSLPDDRLLGRAEDAAKALVEKLRKPLLAKDQAKAARPPNDEEAEQYGWRGFGAQKVGIEAVHTLLVGDEVEVTVEESIAADYDAILVQYRVWTVDLDADGVAKLRDDPAVFDGFTPKPMARRDIDGDGVSDTVVDNGCSTSIRSVDGEVLYETGFRCCGC